MDIYICQQHFSAKYSDIDLSEYFTFIEQNSLPTKVKFTTASHHILPKWAFPEFSKLSTFKWNCSHLTYKNHMIAHFLLWKNWRAKSNASPLLLMCRKTNVSLWDEQSIHDYSELYNLACIKHAESVSLRCKNLKASLATRKNISNARKAYCEANPGMMNFIDIATGKNVYITASEYNSHKGTKYMHYKTGTPAWNSGKPQPHRIGKLSRRLKETNQLVELTSEEYLTNKHLYIPQVTADRSKLAGYVPAYNSTTNEIERVSTETYHANTDLYAHPAKNTIWVNNGIENLRLHNIDNIPDGYTRGRINTNLKGSKKKTTTCPHCNKTGGAGNLKRYHFENCKMFTKLI